MIRLEQGEAFGVTPAQYRAQIVKNARSQSEMVEAARKLTESGKGGPHGKRYRGWFFHQHVSCFVQTVMESYSTDEQLQPMCDMMARVFARNAAEKPAIMARAKAERTAREKAAR